MREEPSKNPCKLLRDPSRCDFAKGKKARIQRKAHSRKNIKRIKMKLILTLR